MREYTYLRKTGKQDFTKVLVWKTIVFCLFFTIAALLVAVFLPAESIKDDGSSLSIVPRDVFFTEQDLDYSEELITFDSMAKTQAGGLDKGLELYRDARSKAAVEWFYLHITGNRDVTHAILQEASRNDIPLSLAFSLAYVESHFKTTAVNKNKNSSIDRGLFQLNSSSFPQLSEKDFFDPNISAKYGMQHLRFCLDIGGKEITALAMYNAGTVRVRKNNTPTSTLNYVDAIMRYRAGLEAAFSDEIIVLYEPEKSMNTRLALLK